MNGGGINNYNMANAAF